MVIVAIVMMMAVIIVVVIIVVVIVFMTVIVMFIVGVSLTIVPSLSRAVFFGRSLQLLGIPRRIPPKTTENDGLEKVFSFEI